MRRKAEAVFRQHGHDPREFAAPRVQYFAVSQTWEADYGCKLAGHEQRLRATAQDDGYKIFVNDVSGEAMESDYVVMLDKRPVK